MIWMPNVVSNMVIWKQDGALIDFLCFFFNPLQVPHTSSSPNYVVHLVGGIGEVRDEKIKQKTYLVTK